MPRAFGVRPINSQFSILNSQFSPTLGISNFKSFATTIQPRSGDRHIAWGVSPRFNRQENLKPRSGDRPIEIWFACLSPLQGWIHVVVQFLGLTPQAMNLSRLRR